MHTESTNYQVYPSKTSSTETYKALSNSYCAPDADWAALPTNESILVKEMVLDTALSISTERTLSIGFSY
ncbi:MAG: hypothetical protein ACK5WS_01625 [Alphaproteobacteria bacterium]|jgi:hypothetical protein|nr:hypothetical protein [Candidatus Jidaibacter sp.]